MTNNTTADTTAKGEQWVLLVKGQEVLPGDQMLGADAETWITLASPQGQIFDPAKNPPVRRNRGAIRRDDDMIVPMALWEEMDRVGLEWKARAEAAEADLHWIKSMPDEERMFVEIEHAASASLRRHRSSTRGQTLTRADSSDSHLIWAALEWAARAGREWRPTYADGKQDPGEYLGAWPALEEGDGWIIEVAHLDGFGKWTRVAPGQPHSVMPPAFFQPVPPPPAARTKEAAR